MLSIKLKPVGRKGQISYRIVVAEARSKLKGRFVEDLGWYNPYTNGFKVDEEKTKKWLSNGAQATDSVHNLLVKAGVCPGPKKAVHSTKKRKTEEGFASEGGGESMGLPAQAGSTKEKIKEVSISSDASSGEPESKSPEGVGKEKPEEPKEKLEKKESEEKKQEEKPSQEDKPSSATSSPTASADAEDLADRSEAQSKTIEDKPSSAPTSAEATADKKAMEDKPSPEVASEKKKPNKESDKEKSSEEKKPE